MIAAYADECMNEQTMITALLLGTMLIGIWWGFRYKSKVVSLVGPGPLIFISAVILLRMYLPFEFRFTRHIYCKGILNGLFHLFCREIRMASFSMTVAQFLEEIWAVGVILLFLRKLNVYLYFQWKIGKMEPLPEKIINQCLKDIQLPRGFHRIRIVLTDRCESPYIMGLFRVAIVLPDWGWDLEKLSYALKHEISHFRYRDLWVKAVVDFLETLLWWNPFVSFLKKETFRMMEIRNDLRVTSRLNNEEKAKYLECLVYVVSKIQENTPQCSMGFAKKSVRDLKERMEIIVHPPRQGSKAGRLAGLLMGAMILSTTAVVFEPTLEQEKILTMPMATQYTVEKAENKKGRSEKLPEERQHADISTGA